MSKYDRFLKRLIKEMTTEGYSVIGAFDGEEWHLDDLIENATASDIGALRFAKGDNRVTYTLIYGNAYYETIADYSWNTDEAQKTADEVSTKVYDHFEKLSSIYA